MSFEEYAQHMTNKYKLAVAIAIIQKKPDNLTNEQYISELKQKLCRYDAKDVNVTDEFDLNDEDFNFDESGDLNIIDGLNQCFNSQRPTVQYDDLPNSLNKYKDDTVNEHSNKIDLQTTSVDLLQGPYLEVNGNKDEDVPEKINDEPNSLHDILETFRHIDNDKEHLQTKNATQEYFQITPTFMTNLNSDYVTEAHTNENIHVINLFNSNDTQVTVDDRIRNNVAKNINKICETKLLLDESNKEQSKSFRNDGVSSVNIDNTHENYINKFVMEVDEQINEDSEKDKHIVKEKHEIVSKNIQKQLNNPQTKSEQNAEASYNDRNTANNMTEMEIISHAEDCTDTQNTVLYTLQEFTQNYSHISQSQCLNIEIPQMFLHGNKNSNKIHHIDNNEQIEANKNIHTSMQNQETYNSNNIKYIIDHTGKTYAVLESYPANNNTNINPNNLNNNDIQISQEPSQSQRMEDKSQDNSKIQETIQINDEQTIELDQNVMIEDKNFDTKMEDSQDIVPFKVVQELSKIKAFLDRDGRNTGFSADSGYKSDSQSSCKSVRQSYDWVYQSAHCLYNYIVECPLVAVTQEIVSEVSQVLGRLIDRLHEEEKYPAFLEELLEKVDTLLQDLSRDSGKNVLIEKDEIIQRLLLLNKSIHILKFSLEKIVKNLEIVHTNLASQETLYELASIEEIENLRYIFYILESFIQKYIQIKSTSTQSTQNSQETKTLKRSSITEIWRKKWCPNSGETKNAASLKESCILNGCGDILNKIIVDCMENYSLVSFAALQCFNLLQN